MPRQSLVSVRHLRRNFDDGRLSAEGHPWWHNQPGSKSELFGGHMQARFYAGARGPSLPQFVVGPQIFEGFPVFYYDSVCDDVKWPRGQAARILGLEPRRAICLAQ